MEKVFQYVITEEETLENIFKDDQIQINHIVIPPGKVFPKHPTDAEVFIMIVDGELDVATGDDYFKTYRPGQLINIPMGTVSELGNRGTEVVELFVLKR